MKQVKKPFWVNAETIMKMTGFDFRAMSRLRRDNPDWYDKVKGRFVYDANVIPETMIKQKLTA